MEPLRGIGSQLEQDAGAEREADGIDCVVGQVRGHRCDGIGGRRATVAGEVGSDDPSPGVLQEVDPAGLAPRPGGAACGNCCVR